MSGLRLRRMLDRGLKIRTVQPKSRHMATLFTAHDTLLIVKHSNILYTFVHLWIVFCICETYFMKIYLYHVHVNGFLWKKKMLCTWIVSHACELGYTCASRLLRELLMRSFCLHSFALISCLDSHSDGTYSLQRICWWASDVMLNFSKFVLMKKQTTSWVAWGCLLS